MYAGVPTASPVPEGLTLDVRHHVVEEPVGFTRIEERQDVRMLQIGGGLDLLDKPLGPERRGEFGLQDFSATLRSCFRSSAR